MMLLKDIETAVMIAKTWKLNDERNKRIAEENQVIAAIKERNNNSK